MANAAAARHGSATAGPAARPRADRIDRAGAVAAALALGILTGTLHLEHGASQGGEAERSRQAPAGDVRPAARETLVAGYVGAPWTHPSDLRFEGPGATRLTVHDVRWEGRPFKSPIYYGLRAMQFRDGSAFGSMVDFTHSKAIAIRDQTVRLSGERNGRPAPPNATIGDTFRHMEFSHGHNMLTLNGLLRLRPAAAGIVPYVGGGAGINLPHTEVQFADETERTYEYQYTGPVGQVVAGIEIRLPHSSVFIEYKLTLARYVAPLTGRDSRFSYGPDDFLWQLLDWWRGVKPKHGTVTTTLASHELIGGVGWRAGGTAAAAP